MFVTPLGLYCYGNTVQKSTPLSEYPRVDTSSSIFKFALAWESLAVLTWIRRLHGSNVPDIIQKLNETYL